MMVARRSAVHPRSIKKTSTLPVLKALLASEAVVTAFIDFCNGGARDDTDVFCKGRGSLFEWKLDGSRQTTGKVDRITAAAGSLEPGSYLATQPSPISHHQSSHAITLASATDGPGAI